MMAASGSQDDSSEIEKVEDFFGVYLLVSQNPKYNGRTYVGFTVDPENRLKQHNGEKKGGAAKTSNRGPWAMVLIVHGFPNMISALRFEWAWQHPQRSRRLNQVPGKKKTEKRFPYHIRLLSEMLNTGPWCRLPLSIRWLRPDLKGNIDFPRDKPPPIHMPILYGQVRSVKLSNNSKKSSKSKKNKKSSLSQEENPDDKEADDGTSTPLLCGLCFENVPTSDQVSCLSPKCGSVYHIICLANEFRSKSSSEKSHFLPLDGHCAVCNMYLLWGDIIRKKKGCYKAVENFEQYEDDYE